MSRKMLAPMIASPFTTPRKRSTRAPSPLGTTVARKKPSSAFENHPMSNSSVAWADDSASARRSASGGRSSEGLARRGGLGRHHTPHRMVVDQPHRLHEGIHGGRSDELPAALL